VSIKLAILGLLMEGDNYPYEIIKEIKERQMQNYVKIKFGTFYYAVDQLKKDNYIEAINIISENNRPEKTVYSITESGKKLFHKLLLQQLEEQPKLDHPMFVSLIFAQYGDQQQIAQIIERKIKIWEKQLEEIKQIYDEHIGITSRATLHTMWVGYEHNITELNWLRRLLADAKAGRLNEVGQPLGLTPYQPAGKSNE